MVYLLIKNFRAPHEREPYDVVVECADEKQIERVNRVYADKCDSISQVTYHATAVAITISAD
ncbi:MAG: hypothetical protein MJZ30_11475 [Paludibacteraceae bacterium]|nr:hypothetical protein [Paludibacteraceae bacterium]